MRFVESTDLFNSYRKIANLGLHLNKEESTLLACFTSKDSPYPLLLCLGQQLYPCSVTGVVGVELCCGSLRSWEQRLLALSGFLVWLWTALSASTVLLSRDFCLGSPRKLLQMYFRSKFWVLYWTKWDLKHCLQEKWALHWTDKLQKHKTQSVDSKPLD